MVRIVSYNLAQGKHDLRKLAQVVRKAKPDVICLQEVNAASEPFLKFKGYVQTKPQGHQGWFGNVIFSKKAPLKTMQINLPHQKRQALGVQLKWGWVFNVHLASGRDSVQKKVRSAQLTRLFSKLPKGRVAIVGDFNLTGEEGRWNSRLTRRSFDYAPLVPTYCSSNLVCTDRRTFEHPFDRCVFRGTQCRKTKVLGRKTKISDHFGVVWTLK